MAFASHILESFSFWVLDETAKLIITMCFAHLYNLLKFPETWGAAPYMGKYHTTGKVK